jgi:hypothetical protein
LKIKILQKRKFLTNSQNHNTHCKVFAVAFFGGNKDIGYLCKVQFSQAKEAIFFACLFPALQRYFLLIRLLSNKLFFQTHIYES